MSMQRTPRSLIANEGYEAAWTQLTEFFNQPLPPIDGVAQLPPQNPTDEFSWVSRGYAIPIPANINTQVPLLLEDNYRSLFILQNNSIAVAPDIGPTLFMSLDGPVQLVTINGNTFAYNAAIALVPQEGLLLDVRVLGNALYFAWGSSVNTGGSVVTFGSCTYGRTLNSPPLGS